MKVEYDIKCFCGHAGKIICSENPSGTKPRQAYTLQQLLGEHFLSNKRAMWNEIFEGTRATCPVCNKRIERINVCYNNQVLKP